MPLKTIIQTDDFEIWLNAYTSIVDALNDHFDITLNGSDEYSTLAIKNAFRDLMEASLGINKAGIFSDPATDHAYVGQFFDELAEFDPGNVSDYNLVYKHTDGLFYQAQSNDPVKSNVVGIATDVVADAGKVISSGFVYTGHLIAANTKIYLSETVAGEITDTETSIGVGLSLGSGLILLGTVGGSGAGAGGAAFKNYEYTSTEGQTVFTGSDNNSNVLYFIADAVQVFANGILLDSTDYTASSGTSIILNEGLELNDNVDIYGWTAASTGNIANSINITLIEDQHLIENPSFEPNNTLVYLNHLKLVKGIDYDDSITGEITLDSSIDTNVGDIVDIQIYTDAAKTFTGTITAMDDVEGSYSGSATQQVRVNPAGDGIEFGNSWVTLDDNYTFVSGLYSKIFLDSITKSFAITLQSSPDIGYELDLVDLGNNLFTNNVTISRNTQLIEGLSENLVLDINNIKIRLVYSGATEGWKILYL